MNNNGTITKGDILVSLIKLDKKIRELAKTDKEMRKNRLNNFYPLDVLNYFYSKADYSKVPVQTPIKKEHLLIQLEHWYKKEGILIYNYKDLLLELLETVFNEINHGQTNGEEPVQPTEELEISNLKIYEPTFAFIHSMMPKVHERLKVFLKEKYPTYLDNERDIILSSFFVKDERSIQQDLIQPLKELCAQFKSDNFQAFLKTNREFLSILVETTASKKEAEPSIREAALDARENYFMALKNQKSADGTNETNDTPLEKQKNSEINVTNSTDQQGKDIIQFIDRLWELIIEANTQGKLSDKGYIRTKINGFLPASLTPNVAEQYFLLIRKKLDTPINDFEMNSLINDQTNPIDMYLMLYVAYKRGLQIIYDVVLLLKILELNQRFTYVQLLVLVILNFLLDKNNTHPVVQKLYPVNRTKVFNRLYTLILNIPENHFSKDVEKELYQFVTNHFKLPTINTSENQSPFEILQISFVFGALVKEDYDTLIQLIQTKETTALVKINALTLIETSIIKKSEELSFQPIESKIKESFLVILEQMNDDTNRYNKAFCEKLFGIIQNNFDNDLKRYGKTYIQRIQKRVWKTNNWGE